MRANRPLSASTSGAISLGMPSPLASGGIGCSARGSRAAIAALSRRSGSRPRRTAHHSSKAITGSASSMGATSPRSSAARMDSREASCSPT